MPKWTPKQKNAIDARNSNILVSAAAGSGKTAVLTERVVRIITDENNPVDIDKLLVVTFTNAAAAEMRSRIAEKLNTVLTNEPNNTNVIRQLSLLPTAKICTIDAFCMNLVRENFFKLDVTQDFTVLDNSDKALIEDNALLEIIESHYEEDDGSFKKLVELLCSTKNDNDLINAIKRINNYISAQAFPSDWLKSACELYNPEISVNDSIIKEFVFSEVKNCIFSIREIIEYLKTVLLKDDILYDKYLNMLEKDGECIDKIEGLLSSDWDSMREGISSLKFMTMPYKKDYTSPIKEFLKEKREIYKTLLKNEVLPLMQESEEEIECDNSSLYPALCVLCDIADEFSTKLLEIKKELGSYSFSDIEHFAINLLVKKDENGNLSRTDLARELEENYYEILVDEYQDTNAAQDMLFSMLSNGFNLFMVGDVKQSIYRFRLAMPFIFNAKKDEYSYYSEDSNEQNQKIILEQNFRSRIGICDYTNFVFSKLMNRRLGELDYNEEEYLYCGAKYNETSIPSAQLNVVNVPDDMVNDEVEARHIARLIVDKVESKELIKDGDDYQTVTFGDFAVLLRSSKNSLPIYVKAFSEYGIPVNSNNRINLFENNEVRILISLLRAVDNPSRDVPLLATLMSVFYGYSADDIARAVVNHKGTNLYSKISQDKTFDKVITDLDNYRKFSSSMSLESFIRYIISSTSYLSVISAMGNAEQRKQNVLKFVSVSKNFDKGESVGLTAFIRYIDNVISSKIDVDSASVSHIGDNSVSIMTVHQSKGLEFPVCILAGTSHQYNTDDLKGLIQLNTQRGIGVKVNNEEELYRYNSVQYSTIRKLNALALMSENLRVLYVAVTRAKEQFISFASFKNAEAKINSISNKLINNKIFNFTSEHIMSDADFLVLTALLHKDGEELRKLSENDISPDMNFDFDMKISILTDVEEVEISESEEIKPNPDIVRKIEEKLSFEYEREELSFFTSKRSASSLDEKERSFKYFAKSKPAFLDSKGLTPAERGTAMHAFMQYADYSLAKSDLEGEILRLVDIGCLTALQAESLDREKLSAFFESDFAKRIFESDKLYRELKVSSFVEANKLENTEFNDKILVQGIADCVFEEDGELVLVDYKTDFVKDENELLDMYKNQVAFYKAAVSKTLNMNVKETLLYSFCLNKTCIYK